MCIVEIFNATYVHVYTCILNVLIRSNNINQLDMQTAYNKHDGASVSITENSKHTSRIIHFREFTILSK